MRKIDKYKNIELANKKLEENFLKRMFGGKDKTTAVIEPEKKDPSSELIDGLPKTINPFDEKNIYNKNLKECYVHSPKRGGPIEKILKDKIMYFYKGGIWWKDLYDSFNPENYGGQLIIVKANDVTFPEDSNYQQAEIKADFRFLDQSKSNLKESKGAIGISGSDIIKNPQKFYHYKYDVKEGVYKNVGDISHLI